MMSPLACRIVVFSLELVNHLSKFWLFEVASEKTKEKNLCLRLFLQNPSTSLVRSFDLT
jgi:hypothetical protein